jgi:hypothetical protein
MIILLEIILTIYHFPIIKDIIQNHHESEKLDGYVFFERAFPFINTHLEVRVVRLSVRLAGFTTTADFGCVEFDDWSVARLDLS